MRDYILKKSNRDHVSKDVYMSVKHMLASYTRLERELQVCRDRKKLKPEQKQRKALIKKRLREMDKACLDMAAYLEPYSCSGFDVIKAYFSYEYYKAHIHGASSGERVPKWAAYKRELTRKVAARLKIV